MLPSANGAFRKEEPTVKVQQCRGMLCNPINTKQKHIHLHSPYPTIVDQSLPQLSVKPVDEHIALVNIGLAFARLEEMWNVENVETHNVPSS